jgi:hypothetical protein
MKTKKNYFKWLAVATIATFATQEASAQTSIGEDCGCPPIASRTAVNMSSLPGYQAVSGTYGGELTNGASLTCDKIYTLDYKIYIPAGKTLTIQPGTVIKGAATTANQPETATALVIEKGGKIMADGTAECPIIFTAAADPLDGSYPIYNSGKWGGIVILGKAKNNLQYPGVNGPFLAGSGNKKLCVSTGIGVVEGFATSNTQDQFGMAPGATDDLDNSGVMRFVSIRHSGAILAVGSEINGLTLASVGSGTTIENIEIVACADDAIEVFGGTVNLKRISQIFGNDDMFDYDLGWTGKAQFLFGMKAPWSSSTASASPGTVTLTSQTVTAIGVTYGGAGYTSAPTVLITGGSGSGATATANLTAGVVTSITVNTPGSGYLTAPGITFVGGTGVASPDNDNGFECDSDDDKSNYSPRSHPRIYNATIIGNGKSIGSSDNGGLAAINMKEDAEGEIYNSIFANFKNGLNLEFAPQTLYTNGNSYSGWTNNVGTTPTTAASGAVATLTSGSVSAIAAPTTAGAGYVEAPLVVLTAAPSGGTSATATAIVSSGAITGFNITNAGSGYGTTIPTVTILPINPAQNNVVVKCNTFVGVTNPITLGGSTINGTSTIAPVSGSLEYAQFVTTDKNTIVSTLPGFSATTLAFSSVVTSNAITAKNDVIPTPAIALGSGCTAAPADGFFNPVIYRGAFESEQDNWLSDWSFSQILGDIKGITYCPTDINKDGVTNVSDFLELSGEFGNSCN